MDNQEKRNLDMFKRLRVFRVTYPTLTLEGSLARDLFNAIDSVVIELEEHAVAESAGRTTARQGTVSKAVARAAILENLGILHRTARSMAVVRPELEDKFRLPHKGDEQELLTTAKAALAAAEPIKDEFLRREVRESVFQNLADNIAAFEAALAGQNAGKGASTAAGASIDDAIARGLKALRQLDPIVRNKFHHNPAALAAWLSAKRIGSASRRTNTTTPPAPETPTT